MKRLGRDVDPADFWANSSTQYITGLAGGYHQQRLDMVRRLLPADTKQVVDFGCGDGILFEDLAGHVVGFDFDAKMVTLAAERIEEQGLDAEIHWGGVDALSALADASVDLLVAANVLAYLSDSDISAFYGHARRIVRADGYMVVTHSNELFDLFTLNRYTVAFHAQHFGSQVDPLLTRPTEPDRVTFNVRANPLSYQYTLAEHGFTEESQGFAHYHAAPPLLTGQGSELDDRIHPDLANWPEPEQWRLLFQCSIYGSRSRRHEPLPPV